MTGHIIVWHLGDVMGRENVYILNHKYWMFQAPRLFLLLHETAMFRYWRVGFCGPRCHCCQWASFDAVRRPCPVYLPTHVHCNFPVPFNAENAYICENFVSRVRRFELISLNSFWVLLTLFPPESVVFLQTWTAQAGFYKFYFLLSWREGHCVMCEIWPKHTVLLITPRKQIIIILRADSFVTFWTGIIRLQGRKDSKFFVLRVSE